MESRSQIIDDMCDAGTLPLSRADGRPGEKVVNGKCPIPGCDKKGAQATPKHIHACHRRYLLSELRRLFAETVPEEGLACPFAGCDVHVPDADALGAHVNSHVGTLYDRQRHDSSTAVKCCVVSNECAVCPETFSDAPSFSARLQEEHGRCAVKAGYGGIRDDVIEYCETCSLWLFGDAATHYAYHSDTMIARIADSALSRAPPQLGSTKANAAVQQPWCPFCLFDEELADKSRWKTL